MYGHVEILFIKERLQHTCRPGEEKIEIDVTLVEDQLVYFCQGQIPQVLDQAVQAQDFIFHRKKMFFICRNNVIDHAFQIPLHDG